MTSRPARLSLPPLLAAGSARPAPARHGNVRPLVASVEARRMPPGDEVALRWTVDNPGAADVNWGEGTSDETCVVNLLVTPR